MKPRRKEETGIVFRLCGGKTGGGEIPADVDDLFDARAEDVGNERVRVAVFVRIIQMRVRIDKHGRPRFLIIVYFFGIFVN